MKAIKQYLIFLAFSMFLNEILKAVLRSRPDWHVRYVDFLNEQVSHEIDRFKRLHSPREAKDDSPHPATDPH